MGRSLTGEDRRVGYLGSKTHLDARELLAWIEM